MAVVATNGDVQPGRGDLPDNPGLCATCANAQAVRSARGSVFLLCRHAAIDPRYPKYPVLPVSTCAAYSPSAS